MPSKQQKFAEIENLTNCFHFHFEHISKGFELKGKWLIDYFSGDLLLFYYFFKSDFPSSLFTLLLLLSTD
jgi:hypothetical protein